MPGEKILIVEDNLVNQRLLVVILKPHGYILLTAQDGEEAVALASRERPDLILMDLQLPKMNGYAATLEIKSQPGMNHIPVVALTANAVPDEWQRARQAGFSGYITKPIDTRSFPAQVKRLLEGDFQG
jgi:CheY-like chemotaxis protein